MWVIMSQPICSPIIRSVEIPFERLVHAGSIDGLRIGITQPAPGVIAVFSQFGTTCSGYVGDTAKIITSNVVRRPTATVDSLQGRWCVMSK